MPFQV
ncbi:feline leukemia virus subgroup C receptor-related protein 2, partial [Trichonephila inaurata madagascariensis]